MKQYQTIDGRRRGGEDRFRKSQHFRPGFAGLELFGSTDSHHFWNYPGSRTITE